MTKGKGFIEDIAEDAAEEIIGSRGDPVIEKKYIVKKEHNSCAEESVDNADQEKFSQGMVKKTRKQVFHHTSSLNNIDFHQYTTKKKREVIFSQKKKGKEEIDKEIAILDISYVLRYHFGCWIDKKIM